MPFATKRRGSASIESELAGSGANDDQWFSTGSARYRLYRCGCDGGCHRGSRRHRCRWRGGGRRHRPSIRIGPSGAIKGNVISTDVDVSGTLAQKADIKEFLLVRASGRVEGHVNCGDVQVERGAVLAGGIFSVYSAAAEVRPVNDNVPTAAPAETELALSSEHRPKIDAAE
jgi:cytoskeletal protein CcmA (bactofilin family)